MNNKIIENSIKISNDDEMLENIVGKLLVDKGLTIATAESCTGGLVAATLINYGGISASFKEGAVTYSNEAKISRLGVSPETLEKFGAVSKEIAKEMAEGIARTSGTDIGISTTGIAGPGGGTIEKPVGLVYIGLYINKKVYTKKCNFNGSRQEVRLAGTNTALKWLKDILEGENNEVSFSIDK